MLILLEGCDGSGKSTTAKLLAERLPGAVTVHHGSYKGLGPQELSVAYMASLRSALGGAHTIMDRSWLSEPIYADVFRNEPSRISSVSRRMLERAALRCDGVVVLCRPPFERCLQTFRGRLAEEMLKDSGQLKRVYDGYQLLDTHLPVVEFDYTTESIDQLMMWIEAAVLERRAHIKVTLLGDRPNVRTHVQEALQVPFVSFTGAGCSEWLAAQLDDAGISEYNLNWANAFTHDGKDNDTDLLIPGGEVIALGNYASTWCRKYGVTHQVCPHPQYHKRFYFSREYPLIKELKRVLERP
jgi:thymidylate kinase